MNFINIEGLDGSGKSTQLKLLQNYLELQKIKYKYLHFPRTNSPFYGELVARFLRGELGDINSVNPYLVALIYAGDRKDSSELINGWLSDGNLVIVDRYVYSNIAFQCAKIENQDKSAELAAWILEFEYSYNKIPRPDISLFLDVPFSFTENNLKQQRKGSDRDYLAGAADIHEQNLPFQERVRQVYLREVDKHKDFIKITCSDAKNIILPPEVIFEKMRSQLQFV
ncbi:MAG: dTMP kinase [Bacteroidales bacterium]|nr:dTMP kinase [Bacteroidales bacterium]